MKKVIKFITIMLIFKSCVEGNNGVNLTKISFNFLEGLKVEEIDSFAYELNVRNSIDSLKVLYEYRINKGYKQYYYELAEAYFIENDKKGIEILKEGAFYKQNTCLFALAMCYENGTFNLMKGDFKITPNIDSANYFYTIAANNGDLNSQFNLGCNYFNKHMKDSSDKYLKMCISNNEFDESDLKGAALLKLSNK